MKQCKPNPWDEFAAGRNAAASDSRPVARRCEGDKVKALDAGADDYVTKPSAPRNCWRASVRPSDARVGHSDGGRLRARANLVIDSTGDGSCAAPMRSG